MRISRRKFDSNVFWWRRELGGTFLDSTYCILLDSPTMSCSWPLWDSFELLFIPDHTAYCAQVCLCQGTTEPINSTAESIAVTRRPSRPNVNSAGGEPERNSLTLHSMAVVVADDLHELDPTLLSKMQFLSLRVDSVIGCVSCSQTTTGSWLFCSCPSFWSLNRSSQHRMDLRHGQPLLSTHPLFLSLSKPRIWTHGILKEIHRRLSVTPGLELGQRSSRWVTVRVCEVEETSQSLRSLWVGSPLLQWMARLIRLTASLLPAWKQLTK